MRVIALLSLAAPVACAEQHDVLVVPPADDDASVPVADTPSNGGVPPNTAEPPDASAPEPGDTLDPARCDQLTCTAVPYHQCLAELCVPQPMVDVSFSERHACL